MATRHVHQVAAGQRNLHGEAGTLVAHDVLGHLDENLVAGLQRLIDAALPAAEPHLPPINIGGVQNAIAAGSDIDERSLHGIQHVLDTAQVNVPHL